MQTNMSHKLKKVTRISEIKRGDLLLTVCHGGAESVDFVENISNGLISTVDHTGSWSVEERLDTFLQSYRVVYKINSGGSPFVQFY